MLLDRSVRDTIYDCKDNNTGQTVSINYQLGRIIVGIGAAVMLDLDIEKLTPIPSGPKIFAANHPTTTDPGLLTLLSKEPMSILISETLYKVPVLGSYLRNAGHITVVPGHGKQTIELAEAELRSGKNVGIFLEGSLSPEQGGFMPPRTGTARLALLTGVPVIPVGIYLDRAKVHFLRTKVEGRIETSRWCVSGPYAMTVGEAVNLSGDVNDRYFVRSLSIKLMKRVKQLAQISETRIDRKQYITQSVDRLPQYWSRSFPG